ncbi:hypothetical protein [uncultured Brevundimonas sp.]|uniref:hypothetical protein n=1 Tax=uncultured Brevundimonas sp. TaxID=213418 RepID=UPI0030ED2F1E|tara:strand:+ start:2116 stop:2361 length:246 start_codon:yes stop_codon:yes gene_type:complete
MNFRPTTIERAYQLAEGGDCRTVGDIKQKLQSEGHERVQENLYGSSLTGALRKLCQQNYVASEEEITAVAGSDDDDDDDLD